MRPMFVIALFCAALSFGSAEESPVWGTSIPDAVSNANANNRLVLLLFTGSDWCPYCVKLRKEILDTDTFSAFAKDNLVLVELDFPKKKSLPDDVKRANAEAKKAYEIRGFPTVVILAPDGNPVGRMVGFRGTPDDFIRKVGSFKP